MCKRNKSWESHKKIKYNEILNVRADSWTCLSVSSFLAASCAKIIIYQFSHMLNITTYLAHYSSTVERIF